MYSKNPVWSRFAALFLVVASLFFSPLVADAQQSARIVGAIDDHQLVPVKGSVHPLANSKYDQGAVDPNLPMSRAILVLKRSDAQESKLKARIAAMHDPHSAQFHQWLTPQQFGTEFGVSSQDIATISSWLTSKGFKIDKVANGRQSIEFSGTANAVENAFHTSIHSYNVKGVPHYANATVAQIPAALAPAVTGVLSLHNFEKQSSIKILGKAQVVADAAGNKKLKYDPSYTSQSNGSHAVAPGDLWTIYNSTPLITATSNKVDGTGQTIAIAGRSDIDPLDYSGFRSFLLPAPYASTVPFQQIQNGPDPGIVSGDDEEQTLDVEYSTAMAPGAQIDLVVSGSTNTTDGIDLSTSYIVDNNLASVMSTSYGSCEALIGEAGNTFYNSLWEQAAAQGITSMVSSGDNGSAGCDIVGPSGEDNLAYVADEGLQVSALASTPYNIAVGGNEFTGDSSTYWASTNGTVPAPLTSALSYVPEGAWNESCSPLVCGDANANIAAGSGGSSGCFNPVFDANNNITSCSGGYATPDWQTGVTGIPTNGMRSLPDVSLTAAVHDGYLVCYAESCENGGAYIFGGTSASSPSFAGVMSLVNQKTGSRQGQANYTLYRLAAAEYGSTASPLTANLSACNATQGNASASSCIFHDVTTGSNAVPCDGGTLNCSSTTVGEYGELTGYASGAGYDRASGLGSINITNLVNQWNTASYAATTTTLSIGATTSTFGQPVAINVAVTPTSGSGVPTGNIALLTDSTQISAAGAGSLALTNGAYTGNISSLPGGTYHVSARYAGDGSYSSSSSAGVAMVVNPATSSTGLTFSAIDPVTGATSSGSVPYGSTASATVKLTGVAGQAVPTGTVTFSSAGTLLSTQQTDATGVATYNSSGNAVGTYTWTAAYGGNNNYQASGSPAATLTIVKAATVAKIYASASYVVGSGAATLTSVIQDDSKGLSPTGNLTFTVNGNVLGSSPITAYTDPSTGASAGSATITLPASALTAGANQIVSSYAGDGNYLASSSSTLIVGYSSVAATNTISFTASPSAVSVGGLVTLTATVGTGSIPATAGTVTFFDGKTVLGSAQVAGSTPGKGRTSGTAVLTLQLAPGAHSLTASYGGIQAAPTAVVSTASTVTVTGATPSSVTLTAAANATDPLNYDLTGTVTGFGFAAPTAAVDFSETTLLTDFGTAAITPSTVTHSLLNPKYFSDGDSTDPGVSQSVVGDFNGDGIPDMATTNTGFNGGTLGILIGNGDGTFKPAVTYPAGVFTTSLVTGDFNGDGIMDIELTSQYRDVQEDFGEISVFLGNGDGTFQPQITTAQDGYPVGSVAGDFNRDGILDIVSLQYYPMQISVQFGNGDGSFQSPVDYPIVYQDFSSYSIAAGDLNGDGALDLVETNSGDATVGVFLNTGNGTFVNKSFLTVGNQPEWVAVADLNSDGKQDIVVTNYADNTLGVLLGNGDGTFSNQATYKVSGYVSSFSIADMNGDGKQDIVGGYFYPTADVGVLLGNGDGTFGLDTLYPTNQGHGYAVTLADLNGDGTPDVISSDINSGDPATTDIAILLNVTQSAATKTNVAVAGATSTQQQVISAYPGDATYGASSSAGVFVKGSGATATPQILWSPAPVWGAGVPLGTSVLNGAVNGGIAGTITYTAQVTGGSPVAITTASTLTLGSYTLTLTFTPSDSTNYTVATAVRTIQIVAADFSLAATPQTVAITAGGSATVTVSLPALYGYTGTLALSCATPLPGGFTCSSAPASITAGGTSTVTIQTSGLAAVAGISKPVVSGRGSWMAGGGVALTIVLLLPGATLRRRKLSALLAVIVMAMVGGLQGCGGASYSQATVALQTSATSAASGTSVTLQAAITSKNTPKGSVTFYNGTTVLGTAAAFGNATPSLQVSTLPVGLNSLTAVYSGDSNDSSATSNAVSQLITGQTSVQVQATDGTTTHSTTVNITLQ